VTDPLVRVTPAQLGAFLDCPRRYRHEYVDRPMLPKWSPSWAHLGVGNAVHLALAAWWDLPDQERTPAAGARLVAKEWPRKGFRDDAQSEAMLKLAQGWVCAYLTNADPYRRPWGIERTVSAVEVGLNLSGRVDRVDFCTNRLVVVDYKTGRKPLTDYDAASSYALALYVLATGRTFKARCNRAELHHLPTGDVLAVDYDRQRLFTQIERIGQIAGDIRVARDTYDAAPDAGDELFPTRPGPLCASCPFREHCPTGQAAAPAAKSWQYLPDTETEHI
jgi:putative RecB family exonuclease